MAKTNIDILREIDINLLNDIASRLGMDIGQVDFDKWGEFEGKERIKRKINDADARQIMRWWSGYHIGDSSWADEIITKYEKIKKARGEK